MLVHSYIYYVLGDNVVSDHRWQEWANDLVKLQKENGWEFGFYDSQFQDWDASTGYHLKYDPDIQNAALKVVRLRDRFDS